MDFISSDTNVWIDFSEINKLALPFKLPYTYIMDEDTIEKELLYPITLKNTLLTLGLKKVSITAIEFIYADDFGQKYKKLSTPDRIALAIAKNRNYTLLTGDLHLRNAAKQEGVAIIGTLGILDKLFQKNLIDKEEYIECLNEFKNKNNGKVRLPEDEINYRLSKEGLLFLEGAKKLSE